jgi:hypothetical protein
MPIAPDLFDHSQYKSKTTFFHNVDFLGIKDA